MGYTPGMTVPATSRQTRIFEDRAEALAHFFVRAGEAPRLLAFDDAVGCPLQQALAVVEWTAAVGILAEDDLIHAARLATDAAAAVVERRGDERRGFAVRPAAPRRALQLPRSRCRDLMLERGRCGYTTPHRVDGRAKD